MRHSTLSFNSSSHPETKTQIGCQQSLIRLTAPKANQYSIDHFDHHIIGANEDIFLDTDGNANPQLSKKLFIKIQYVFTIKSLNKKYDHVISAALRDIQAHDSYFNKFKKLSLTFHFLTHKKRDLHCSHDVMLRTKQTQTYTNYKFNNIITLIIHHHDKSFINFNILIPKTPYHSFLTSHFVFKILTSMPSSNIMIPSPRYIYSAP